IARRLPMGLRRLVFFSVHRQFGGRFRYIVSGGAALDPALGESWRELGVEVIQGYGTTECSPGITFNRLGLNRLGSVGTPLPGVEVKVADDGEVLARGANVFKGYWENEEATRAVLDRDGWYHTGDLGKLDEDGFLWLHGRKKDMIVLADGTKVYPEDIENTLAADPRIEAVATPLRPEVATRAGTRELSQGAKLIAEVATGPAAAIHPGATLSADLGLDSLGRVDLLGAIEEELGAYIDDAAVEPNATVAELEQMVAAARD